MFIHNVAVKCPFTATFIVNAQYYKLGRIGGITGEQDQIYRIFQARMQLLNGINWNLVNERFQMSPQEKKNRDSINLGIVVANCFNIFSTESLV